MDKDKDKGGASKMSMGSRGVDERSKRHGQGLLNGNFNGLDILGGLGLEGGSGLASELQLHWSKASDFFEKVTRTHMSLEGKMAHHQHLKGKQKMDQEKVEMLAKNVAAAQNARKDEGSGSPQDGAKDDAGDDKKDVEDLLSSVHAPPPFPQFFT